MRFPVGTVILSAVVVAAYFILSGGNLYIPSAELEATAMQLAKQPWGILTHLVTHVGLLHLIGNLIPLIAFGLVIETRLKSYDLIVIFVLSGIISAGLFALFNPSTFLVGASAGISGLIGAAAVVRPKYAIAALIATPLIIAGIFPFANAVVAGQQEQLALQKQQLNQSVAELVKQNKTAEAAEANATLQGVSQSLDVISGGKKRENETPTDYSVHVFGALAGALYVYFFRRKELKGGVREFESLGDKLLDLFGFEKKAPSPQRRIKKYKSEPR